MPVGSIAEVEEGCGVYKIRTNYDDRTVYEIQNRNKQGAKMIMAFKDCTNIRFEPSNTVSVDPAGTESAPVYRAIVKAGDTVTFVTLYTAVADEPWSFDYDLVFEGLEPLEWLS